MSDNDNDCDFCGREMEEVQVRDGNSGRLIRTENICVACEDSMHEGESC